jgi:hypothetical protein
MKDVHVVVRRNLIALLGVIGLALTLSACSNVPASVRSRMQGWANNQSYPAAESTVAEDLSGIKAGIRLNDLPGIKTDCIGFNTDLDQIYQALPAPDVTVTNDLNEAITKYWSPGSQTSCYSSSSITSAKFKKFQSDLSLGDVWYRKAEAIIHGFGIK